MNNLTRTYTRLPGRRLGLAQRASLWLGPDHVLVVHETMTGESYRRFFFRDIKSIAIRTTSRRQTTTVVLAVLVAIGLLPLFALTSSDPGARGFAWMALGSAVCGGLALVNLLRGPTCETRFRTAVQDDVVAPLARLRTARRVVELLRPRILAAQAEIAADVSPVAGDTRS